MLEPFVSAKLPYHLYFRDKDSPKSAQITEDVGLKEQPLLRLVSPAENGHFCLHMIFQLGEPTLGIES